MTIKERKERSQWRESKRNIERKRKEMQKKLKGMEHREVRFGQGVER